MAAGGREIVGPESMSGNGDDLFQHRNCFARTDGGRNYFCVGGDAYKSELRHRTRGPRFATDLAEPDVRLRVMDVLRPRQRNQNISVQQVVLRNNSVRRSIQLWG